MYNWMTANDAPNRDPTKWTLDGAISHGCTSHFHTTLYNEIHRVL
jgi:hypothetical protein